MGYQPPEVNNLNTPTLTGLNDYVWQTQVAVVETVAAFFISAVGFQGVAFIEVIGPISEDGEGR